MEKRKKLALSTQIFIALVLAIGAGIALTGNPDFAKSYIKPFGTIFLNLIKWIVCPLVFFSIMAGVVSMRDIKKVGVIGGRTILYYMCTTAFAVAIGLLFANLLKGIFPVLSTAELSYEPAATSVNFMDTLVGIFPSNFLKPFVDANMLQIIVSSLFIGFALILIMSVEFALVAPLFGLLMNYVSRKAEYRADAQAVKEGYGESLITGLTQLVQTDFGDVAPSPVLILLEYSHPSLSQRIDAIEAEMNE